MIKCGTLVRIRNTAAISQQSANTGEQFEVISRTGKLLIVRSGDDIRSVHVDHLEIVGRSGADELSFSCLSFSDVAFLAMSQSSGKPFLTPYDDRILYTSYVASLAAQIALLARNVTVDVTIDPVIRRNGHDSVPIRDTLSDMHNSPRTIATMAAIVLSYYIQTTGKDDGGADIPHEGYLVAIIGDNGPLEGTISLGGKASILLTNDPDTLAVARIMDCEIVKFQGGRFFP